MPLKKYDRKVDITAIAVISFLGSLFRQKFFTISEGCFNRYMKRVEILTNDLQGGESEKKNDKSR